MCPSKPGHGGKGREHMEVRGGDMEVRGGDMEVRGGNMEVRGGNTWR